MTLTSRIGSATALTPRRRSQRWRTPVMEGGTAGTKYKITVKLTTTAGLVKEVDFTVLVKEI